jgi:hypothetical protein
MNRSVIVDPNGQLVSERGKKKLQPTTTDAKWCQKLTLNPP